MFIQIWNILEVTICKVTAILFQGVMNSPKQTHQVIMMWLPLRKTFDKSLGAGWSRKLRHLTEYRFHGGNHFHNPGTKGCQKYGCCWLVTNLVVITVWMSKSNSSNNKNVKWIEYFYMTIIYPTFFWFHLFIIYVWYLLIVMKGLPVNLEFGRFGANLTVTCCEHGPITTVHFPMATNILFK